jgi:hypothetical protein
MADVLTTQQALDLITQMAGQIDGPVTSQINTLKTQGQRLSDPNVFAGGYASKFRSTWSEATTVMNKMVTDLNELRTNLDKAHQSIISQGGGLGS